MNQEKSDYDEIDLIDLFRIVLNSWKLIAVIFLLSIVIVGSVTYFWLPKKYRSEALFYLEADGGYGSTFGKAEMVKDVIQTNYFLRSILEKNDLETSQGKIEQLGQAITISQTEAGNIALELIWDDPQQAYALLSSVYDGYKDEVARRITNYTTSKLELAEAQLERSKEVFDRVNGELAAFQEKKGIVFLPAQLAISDQYYQDFKGKIGVSPEDLWEYENLVAQHEAARADYTKAYALLEDTRRLVEQEQKYSFVMIEPPVYPERKHSPSTLMNTTVAGVLALFAGVMLAFLRDYIRKYKERVLNH